MYLTVNVKLKQRHVAYLHALVIKSLLSCTSYFTYASGDECLNPNMVHDNIDDSDENENLDDNDYDHDVFSIW